MSRTKNKIPTNIIYHIARDIPLSYEEVTDADCLKMTKPQLQSYNKTSTALILKQKKHILNLEAMVGSYESMALLLQAHGYTVTKNDVIKEES